jgi:hypothetical protein
MEVCRLKDQWADLQNWFVSNSHLDIEASLDQCELSLLVAMSRATGAFVVRLSVG